MPRREYTGNWPCREAQNGCRERARYIYDTRAEYAEAAKRYAKAPWTCTRHTRPEAVLGADNSTRTVEVVASRIRFGDYDRRLAEYKALIARGIDWAQEPAEYLPGLFWVGEGTRNGFVDGPGFKAFASDFPEGTRLSVTATIHLPDD